MVFSAGKEFMQMFDDDEFAAPPRLKPKASEKQPAESSEGIHYQMVVDKAPDVIEAIVTTSKR